MLVAVALVVGAVLVRARLDDGDEVTTVASTVPATGRIVCDESLAQACRAALPGVTIEAAGTTIAALTASDAEPVTWVTLAPMPELVDEARNAIGLDPLFVATERVATSPLVAVTSTERAELIEVTCAGVTLKCIGDNAGTQWTELGATTNLGAVRPAHEAPDVSARGAIVYAWLATAFSGGPQFDPRNVDFPSWVRQLARPVSPLVTPTEELIVRQGAFDIALTTEADVSGATERGYRVLYPLPMVQAEVVVAGAATPLTEALRNGLEQQGWQAAEGAPTGAGLPSAGVVQALRTVSWKEVGR